VTDITLFEPVRPAPRSLQDVYKEIRQVYKQYPHPWVVGYSGGKDSTTVLQMIWYALAELPESERTKPVYVISSDTLVETPMIVGYIDETLRRINEAAAKQNMPFTAQKLVPQLEDTFWINLIGKGYPAPSNNFRWCTDRLKIKPSNRFILSKVTEYGEVILALGIRRGESSTRDQVINMHRFTGHKLARHGQLPGAWVYMPLEHFTTEDIWQYLLQVPSPWGNDNSQLAALYRSAQSGECPLVIDKDTASCGNSRFGCWTCTVVSRDRSMEAMIDGGQDWMIPLLEFRDWLATTQEPDIKPQQREYKGRDGRIKITPDGKVRYRTYRLEFSKGMLRRLLLAQREVQQTDPDFVLISEEEIREIRRIWMSERQDWEDTVPSIYAEVNGRPLMLEQDDVSTPGRMEAELLDQITAKHDLPLRLVQKLLDMEWQHYGMRRRTSIHSAIEKVLREDWRTLEEARADVPTIPETADLVLMAETEE
jgi:DNA sulfur modification protein DndC